MTLNTHPNEKQGETECPIQRIEGHIHLYQGGVRRHHQPSPQRPHARVQPMANTIPKRMLLPIVIL